MSKLLVVLVGAVIGVRVVGYLVNRWGASQDEAERRWQEKTNDDRSADNKFGDTDGRFCDRDERFDDMSTGLHRLNEWARTHPTEHLSIATAAAATPTDRR